MKIIPIKGLYECVITRYIIATKRSAFTSISILRFLKPESITIGCLLSLVERQNLVSSDELFCHRSISSPIIETTDEIATIFVENKKEVKT